MGVLVVRRRAAQLPAVLDVPCGNARGDLHQLRLRDHHLLVCIAVWRQNPTAGGYDVKDAVTYAWLGQAMIMTVAVSSSTWPSPVSPAAARAPTR
ncbi:MAG: hypothetical protein H0X54_04245 [Propionibacteriales bacterium]|nr:hypothetical protein [Propionibacteriales bacterium]